MHTKNAIELHFLTKTYQVGGEPLTVLDIQKMTIAQREWVSITGQSGSGKTTLLHILGCLDLPTAGTYLLNSVDTTHLTPATLSKIRNSTIGFIFQRFNLLATLTAAENIALPLRYAGLDPQTIAERLDEMFTLIGLNERRNHYPHQLSGGQQQRIAIARALIIKPSLILADEPTGSLDSTTGQEILKFLKMLHSAYPITIVLITHDPDVAAHGTRVVHIKDGRIFSDTANL
ncbi:MAG: putative transport system ATP-binding protein [Candidatus Dependentiae bacterium]|nr:putative transport system ATP-binding protein [Candidatus Dependentiae bacterium]